ncbi:unnamed protein product [Dibothriocephalus latus]|uniref:PH domain-containing protein n=1 Tax=Dibothriocephalus latus TaxID=60516 RepID=A0A3P7M047_DIBLA|nr:unnamed protein product [Dibothriocephalus latus]
MSYSLKEGHLQKWSGTSHVLFDIDIDSKNRFNPVYAKLLSSGWFQWFESQSSQSPKRSIDVRTVAPFIAFTTTLYQVPCRPSSIGDSDIQRAFGMPHEPHKGTKMSFFVCPDVNELSAWVNAITGLLVTLPFQLQPAQSGIPSGAVGPPYASAPPPYQPAPSSGGIGFGGTFRN